MLAYSATMYLGCRGSPATSRMPVALAQCLHTSRSAWNEHEQLEAGQSRMCLFFSDKTVTSIKKTTACTIPATMQTESTANMVACSPNGSLVTPATDFSTVKILSVLPLPKSTAAPYKRGSRRGASDSAASFLRMASETCVSMQNHMLRSSFAFVQVLLLAPAHGLARLGPPAAAPESEKSFQRTEQMRG